jgi:tRNA/rRNA methyltransferase
MTDPLSIRVVVVEPEYQINLGYIARIMKNFGVSDLRLVNPKCDVVGKDSVKYSKHAVGLLRNAKICPNMKGGTLGCDMVVGTTAIWHKTESSFFNVYQPDKIKRMIKGRKVCIVLGREGTGLSKDELTGCDAVVSIPTNRDYETLNISHALAVLLYELAPKGATVPKWIYSNEKDMRRLVGLFALGMKKRTDVRDKKKVTATLSHILHRAQPTRKELSALAIAFSPKGKNSR